MHVVTFLDSVLHNILEKIRAKHRRLGFSCHQVAVQSSLCVSSLTNLRLSRVNRRSLYLSVTVARLARRVCRGDYQVQYSSSSWGLGLTMDAITSHRLIECDMRKVYKLNRRLNFQMPPIVPPEQSITMLLLLIVSSVAFASPAPTPPSDCHSRTVCIDGINTCGQG